MTKFFLYLRLGLRKYGLRVMSKFAGQSLNQKLKAIIWHDAYDSSTRT
jgi:hypothetical protein